MIKHTMKDIYGRSDRRFVVRFCRGYEKMICIEDLRLRYDYLSEEELMKMMREARLSSDGKWLLFGDEIEWSADKVYLHQP